jgi:hypothetical protein
MRPGPFEDGHRRRHCFEVQRLQRISKPPDKLAQPFCVDVSLPTPGALDLNPVAIANSLVEWDILELGYARGEGLGGTLPAVFQEEDVGVGKRRIIDPWAVFIELHRGIDAVFKRIKLFESPIDFRLISYDLPRHVDLLEKLGAATFALHVEGVKPKESDAADRKSVFFQDGSVKSL